MGPAWLKASPSHGQSCPRTAPSQPWAPLGLEALGHGNPASGDLLPASRTALLGLSHPEAEEVPVVRLRAALALQRLDDQTGS